MLKKITALCLMLLLLCGCSREAKFGLQQFVSRINEQFDTTYETKNFLYAENDGNRYLFHDGDEGLVSLIIDKNNDITGVSLLITESMDINAAVNTFTELCCVFTDSEKTSQKKLLSDCNINGDTIKFADSNMVITIGKYKYTVICNEYSVTLFCDRI